MDRNRKLVSLGLIAPKKRKHRGVLLLPNSAAREVRPYTPEQVHVLRAAENLGRTCRYEADHTNHVTGIALQLFDGLQRLHHLNLKHRFYLECAGILHDIGWIEGWKGHHKASLRMILRTTLLPLEHRERLIIGSVARYHTRALPGLQHDHFAALDPIDRGGVQVLAACLRLADALDRNHRGQVQAVRCRISRRKIRILYRAAKRQLKNEKAALKNSDLLKLVFNRDVSIRMEKNA